jgi:hypothetical protein
LRLREVNVALIDFLKAERNSVTREALLRHKFIFDVGLAAARRGYALQVFLGEVDREGFDVVVDDGDNTRKVQLKSVMGKRKIWPVQKNLLRPEPQDVATFGLLAAPPSTGVGGAVVLQIVSCEADAIEITYAVTDMALLCAMEAGLITKRVGGTMKRATIGALIDATVTGKRTDRVYIPRNAFVRTRSSGHLLAALGLHSADVHCGDLGGLVGMAKSDESLTQRGARALLVEHMRAISPDFAPASKPSTK